MNIYTDVFRCVETRSSTDPPQCRQSTCSALPDTSHPHWKCCLMVITVTTKSSDLSFKYTHGIILPFLHWKKKMYENYLCMVWFLFYTSWLSLFKYLKLSSAIQVPYGMWLSAAELTDKQAERNSLPLPTLTPKPKCKLERRNTITRSRWRFAVRKKEHLPFSK